MSRKKAPSGATHEAVQKAALEIDHHLHAVRQTLLRPVWHEIARSRLTGPQLAVLRAVVAAEGISLKELSREVGLAHSTVSGIVDRLAQRGLVQRKADQRDGRVTRVVMSAPVRAWMRDELPLIKTSPLVSGLAAASPSEMRTIIAGLRTLRRILEKGRQIFAGHQAMR